MTDSRGVKERKEERGKGKWFCFLLIKLPFKNLFPQHQMLSGMSGPYYDGDDVGDDCWFDNDFDDLDIL